MNTEYINIDNKIIVRDKNGNNRQIEYCDNIDDILEQENIIEMMENRINELELELDKYYSNYKRKKFFPLYSIITTVFSVGLPPLLLFLFNFNNKTALDNIMSLFNTTNPYLFVSALISPIFIPFGIFSDIVDYNNCNRIENTFKGINSELDFLKSQIDIEKQKLDNIKKEATKDNKFVGIKTIKINNENLTNILKSTTKLYRDCGYNEKKYYKYFKKGNLYDKLKKIYTDEGIEKIEEYLSEKGPQLVKKK